MELLSEDDLNLEGMDEDELERAWDLWFDLAQATNDFDPPYTHGVFVGLEISATVETDSESAERCSCSQGAPPGGGSHSKV